MKTIRRILRNALNSLLTGFADGAEKAQARRKGGK